MPALPLLPKCMPTNLYFTILFPAISSGRPLPVLTRLKAVGTPMVLLIKSIFSYSFKVYNLLYKRQGFEHLGHFHVQYERNIRWIQWPKSLQQLQLFREGYRAAKKLKCDLNNNHSIITSLIA